MERSMGYWLKKGIIYYGDKWGNNALEFILPTNCTDWHEGYAIRKMATGSVALIYTNAMGEI